jgi:hypothetical protein
MGNLKFIIDTNLMRTVFFILVMTASSIVHSQEMNTKKNIGALHFLEGSWSIDNLVISDDKWESVGSTKADFNLELNGKYVNEKVKYLTKYGQLTMVTNIGYDSRLKNFKLTNMDADYGNMDVYFGEWVNEDLVFTNLESDLPSILDDGQELYFRLTYTEMSDKSFTHVVEGTTDKGKTWFYFSKSIYSKI